MSLSGRVALVTGASQGIGRGCALKLAASGATVVLAARNQEKLAELVREKPSALRNLRARRRLTFRRLEPEAVRRAEETCHGLA